MLEQRRDLWRKSATRVPSWSSGMALPRLGLQRWLIALQSLAVRSASRLVARLLTVLFRLAVFGALAAAIGLGSAWYMIDAGAELTTQQQGPWRNWPMAGRPDADPYTRAHFARLNWLPMSSATANYFVATVDDGGARLSGDCEYDVTGAVPDTLWWSLSVHDARGMVLEVPAQRYAISAGSLVPEQGDAMNIRLASDARPGNWLPVLGGKSLVLVLRTDVGAAASGELQGIDAARRPLPAIKRVSCR
jgi:hypothetical protein